MFECLEGKEVPVERREIEEGTELKAGTAIPIRAGAARALLFDCVTEGRSGAGGIGLKAGIEDGGERDFVVCIAPGDIGDANDCIKAPLSIDGLPTGDLIVFCNVNYKTFRLKNYTMH